MEKNSDLKKTKGSTPKITPSSQELSLVVHKKGGNVHAKNILYIKFLLKSLHKISDNLNHLLQIRMCDYEDYNQKMANVDELFHKVKELEESFLQKKNSKNLFEHSNLELLQQLKSLILQSCSSEISNNLHLLKLQYQDEPFEHSMDDFKEYIHIYDHFFTPFSIQLFSDENEKTKFLNFHGIEKSDQIIVKNLIQIPNMKSRNLMEKIDGASIIIPFYSDLIVFHGIFKKDSIGICRFSSIYQKKMDALKDDIEYIDIPKDFKEQYLEQITLRDFIVQPTREIALMIKNDYNDFHSLKSKSLSMIIKEFIKSQPEKQRKILIQFLLSDDEAKFNAHIIYDLLISQNITYHSQPLAELIYKSFHWKIQKIFKVSHKTFEDNKKKIENLSIQDVPYEIRISQLKVSDYVKSKAMEKMKEINGSKENSNKAQQWLDGFLKIPFGSYRSEPILKFFGEYKENLENYINQLSIDTFEYENKIKNTNYLRYYELFKTIINEYHSTVSPKSEYSYHLFLIFLQDLISQIHDSDISQKSLKKSGKLICVEPNPKPNRIKVEPEFFEFVDIEDTEEEEHDLSILDSLSEENKKILKKMIQTNQIPEMGKIDKCMDDLQQFKQLKNKLLESPDLHPFQVDLLSNRLEELEKNIKNSSISIQEEKTSLLPVEESFIRFVIRQKNRMNHFIQEWNQFKEKKKDYLQQVEDILDKCTYGQFEAKKQMKRLIAQWMNGNNEKGSVIGLQGPPGVGKTSLLKHGLSKCLLDENGNSRPLIFVPIGGSSNGTFLEGHNYTYLGSTWGKIVDSLMEAKCMNPIVFIDELDKISKTEHGKEIASILTHITDETQNHEFFDRYFASIPIDLSRVLFVFSYNDRDNIDPILRYLMQEIKIDSLSKKEKVVICKNYILPEIFKNVGFGPDEIIFTNQILEHIIGSYTNESGCRRIKEILLNIVRDINLDKIHGKISNFPYYITEEYITEFMVDKPKVTHDKIHEKPLIGISNGLYAYSGSTIPGGVTRIQTLYTYNGGDKGKLKIEKISGLMGDSMKESVDVAFTVAYNLLPQEYKDKMKECSHGLHILCGSISKKDGPSATAIICASIFSRLTGIAIRNDIAATGEMNFIDGNITKIGGLSSKCEGAILAGIRAVVICEENEEDLDSLIRKEREEVKLLQRSSSMRQMDLSPIFEMNTSEHLAQESKYEELKKTYKWKKYKTLDVFVIKTIYELLDIVLVDKIELNRYMD